MPRFVRKRKTGGGKSGGVEDLSQTCHRRGCEQEHRHRRECEKEQNRRARERERARTRARKKERRRKNNGWDDEDISE